MRLDKFLKVSRLIKRRTVAKEVCDQGRVTVNGRPAKAATDVHVGDIIAIYLGHRFIQVRVRECREHVPSALAGELYEVLRETVGPGD